MAWGQELLGTHELELACLWAAADSPHIATHNCPVKMEFTPYGAHWVGQVGPRGCQPGRLPLLSSWWAATSPPSLPHSSPLLPGLTGSLNQGQAQTYGTSRSPVAPQHLGTLDQTYLDERISIPKGGGVGAATLAPPSKCGQRLSKGLGPQGAGGGEAEGVGDIPRTCPGDLSVPRPCSGKSQPQGEHFHA